jgi:hypothetical protein
VQLNGARTAVSQLLKLRIKEKFFIIQKNDDDPQTRAHIPTNIVNNSKQQAAGKKMSTIISNFPPLLAVCDFII